MTHRSLVVLGATGSIGQQTLEAARSLDLQVSGLAARRASRELAELALEWPEARVVVTGATSEELYAVADAIGRSRIDHGSAALADLASGPATVVNGIVGVAGLPASLAALAAGNRLALANKESLVAGGALMLAALDDGGGELIPVDSEHSAIHQLLDGRPADQVDRIVLTASGGPFRGCTADQLVDVTPAQALDHPTWSMGDRISVDSATLANKGLEVIEASVLFGVPVDEVEVVVHPQSLVHSMIRLTDGGLLSHLGETSMQHPIEYAIAYPDRVEHVDQRFDLHGLSLTFEPPDIETFRALRLAYDAARAGGSATAVFNAADEVAVAAFLQNRLSFLSIADVIEATLERLEAPVAQTLEEVMAVDREARSVADELVRAS